jgi:hypothetical protein
MAALVLIIAALVPIIASLWPIIAALVTRPEVVRLRISSLAAPKAHPVYRRTCAMAPHVRSGSAGRP